MDAAEVDERAEDVEDRRAPVGQRLQRASVRVRAMRAGRGHAARAARVGERTRKKMSRMAKKRFESSRNRMIDTMMTVAPSRERHALPPTTVLGVRGRPG